MMDYADVASWASSQKLGDYNNIIEMMAKNKMIPGYESKTFDLYKGVGQDYGYSPELCTILDEFVKANGSIEILI